MGTNVKAADLLPGESVVLSRWSSASFPLKEMGLERLPGDGVSRAMALGMARKKVIVGGKLHLTNFRVLFASRGGQQVQGRLSIFLPSVLELRKSRFGLSGRVEVRTAQQAVEFAVWGAARLIDSINEQQRALGQKAVESVLEQAHQFPSSMGEAFVVHRSGWW
ncbi:MAG: hypothetical protein KDB24_15710 [Microthrixaceae bacterium]|nr:hypothetical protein [Microthrixaceae bacterium]